MNCLLCERVSLIEKKEYPFLIQEFKNSFLLLGEHQFYEGYCVLLSKGHYREMTDMPSELQKKFFETMMTVSKAIELEFNPKKMNMCSLGNVVDHVHWHFFPRYESDAEFKNPPWLQMHLFESAKVTPERRDLLISRIKSRIQKL